MTTLTSDEKILLDYIKERRSVFLQREMEVPPPWTTDETLAHYRFTNVFREDDAVTRWLSYNWRHGRGQSPNFTPAMVLARLFNNVDTLALIGWPEPWLPQFWIRALQARARAGVKLFNAAYIVSTAGAKMDKVEYVINLAHDVQKHVKPAKEGESLEDNYHKLIKINGLGPFLAGQVIADMKNTSSNHLYNAEDWWTWAIPGPGSKRGLERVLNKGVPARWFLQEATHLYERLLPLLDRENIPRMCMQDFQNNLCEISKYMKAYYGTGRPKQRYHPSGL